MQVVLDFGLSEQIFAKAKVKDVLSVGLWLGADVMLEYPLEEAKQLLVGNDRWACVFRFVQHLLPVFIDYDFLHADHKLNKCQREFEDHRQGVGHHEGLLNHY